MGPAAKAIDGILGLPDQSKSRLSAEERENAWRDFSAFVQQIIRSGNFSDALRTAMPAICLKAEIGQSCGFVVTESAEKGKSLERLYRWDLESALADLDEPPPGESRSYIIPSERCSIVFLQEHPFRAKGEIAGVFDKHILNGVDPELLMIPIRRDGTLVFIASYSPLQRGALLHHPWFEILAHATECLYELYRAHDRIRKNERIRTNDLEFSRRAILKSLQDAIVHREELKKVNLRLEDQNADLLQSKMKAEEAAKMKSEFLSTMSHELRTPLNAIIGFLTMSLDTKVTSPEEKTEYIITAQRSAEHLLGIINTVLEIAKIESGNISVMSMDIEIRELFAELKAVMRDRTNPRIRINFHDPEPADLSLFIDLPRLLQVMNNLFDNAVKFTEDGNVDVSARLCGGEIEITIRDTGIGIDPYQYHKLFLPFVQLNSGMNRKYGGVGLGLAISKKLVDLMQGRISISSEGLGRGTEARLSFPSSNGAIMTDRRQPAPKEPVVVYPQDNSSPTHVMTAAVSDGIYDILSTRSSPSFKYLRMATLQEAYTLIKSSQYPCDLLIMHLTDWSAEIDDIIRGFKEAGGPSLIVLCPEGWNHFKDAGDLLNDPIILTVALEERILEDPSPILRTLDTARRNIAGDS